MARPTRSRGRVKPLTTKVPTPAEAVAQSERTQAVALAFMAAVNALIRESHDENGVYAEDFTIKLARDLSYYDRNDEWRVEIHCIETELYVPFVQALLDMATMFNVKTRFRVKDSLVAWHFLVQVDSRIKGEPEPTAETVNNDHGADGA